MRIELKEVGFSYQPGTELAQKTLFGINLSIEQGEFVGLIGPTGAGKSTLVQILNGLLLPDSGKVFIDGVEAGSRKLPFLRVRQRFGLVFQFPENQLFEATVFDDIAYGPRNFRLSAADIEDRVRESMAQVGLDFESFKDRSPFTLSGGEMRRVAIAGILALKPEVIVFDEPTSGLDAEGRKDILAYLENLHRREKLTVILVSHDMDEVAEVAERIIVLDQGRVILDGPADDIFYRVDELERIGLDAPQTVKLMTALRKRGKKLPPVITMKAAAEAIIKAVKTGPMRGGGR